MLTNIFTTMLSQFLPLAFVFSVFIYLAHNYYNRELNKHPGPLVCAFTDWYRFFKAWQRRPEQWHIDLHNKYGDIVRLGPNCLSFSNPKSVKAIYALGKGFTKVQTLSILSDLSLMLNPASQTFTPYKWQHRGKERSYRPYSAPNRKNFTPN
jgi:hypothetical protein